MEQRPYAPHMRENGFAMTDFNIHLYFSEFNHKSTAVAKFYTLNINGIPDLYISPNGTR